MERLFAPRYRMCSLTREHVLLLENTFSYCRMSSLTIERGETLPPRGQEGECDEGEREKKKKEKEKKRKRKKKKEGECDEGGSKVRHVPYTGAYKL